MTGLLLFNQNNIETGLIGTGYAGVRLSGSSNDDLMVISNNHNIRFSANGTSIQGTLASTGAWDLGPETGGGSCLIRTSVSTFHRIHAGGNTAQCTLVISKAQANGTPNSDYVNFYGGATTTTLGTQDGGIRKNAGNTNMEFYNVSDVSLKNILGTYEGGLSIVKNIPVRRYSWKSDENNTPTFGFIAQEVQTYLQSAVGVGKDGLLNLGTSDMIPVLWNAIQEQQILIEDLQARLQALAN